MDKIIAYAKLPLQLDVSKAQGEVMENMSNGKPHFNTSHYTGEWTVIALRSPGDRMDTIIPDARGEEVFLDTPLMQQCPTIKKLVQSFECPIMAVRLLNLKKGAVIKEHRDTDLSFEKGEARLHFPIFTNQQVAFHVASNKVEMQEGSCWYINANLPHKVANLGNADRIHLVIDCKVNDWLRSLFDTAEITSAPTIDNKNEMKMMISELRAQKTKTATQLADKMEAKLNFTNE
jgi:mannose-6-phosphate isomerase-like protein (cupin superfamily)